MMVQGTNPRNPREFNDLNKRKRSKDWKRSVAFFVILLTCVIASVLAVTPHFEEINKSTCIQNCSWRSYDEETSEWIENRCEMKYPGNNAIGCPSIFPVSDSTISQPSQVEHFDVSYYTKIGSDTSEILCANVTFKVRRPGVDLVRGIRLALIGKTYNSLNNHYCVVWDIKSKLSFCSVSSSNCSVNDDVRTFYFDCFCGLDPGSGLPAANEGYLVSVDTLPKLKGQHQEFRLFRVPGCQNFSNHENCQWTPIDTKENWRPLFSSLEQLCNYSGISINFDLPPLEYDVKKISVFLYRMGGGRSVWKKADLIVSQLDSYEKIIFNTTYNVTTLICTERLQLNSSYYVATRIRDVDSGTYGTKRIKSTSIFLRNPPCSINPCSTKEVCIEDCFNYTCVCTTDAIRIKGECEVPWYPKDLKVTSDQSTYVIFFSEIPPRNSRIGKFKIGLFTNRRDAYKHAQTKVDPDGTIYASFNNLQGNKTYTPAVKIDDECPHCQYKFYNSSTFAVHLPMEDTRPYMFIVYTASAVVSILLLACLIWSQRKHKTSKGRVRLVCSQNLYIQNFTTKLRQVLQQNVKHGWIVSMETLNDTSHDGMADWLAEAQRLGDRICFILDHNLTVLDFEESQECRISCKVHSLVDSVSLDELKSPVLLKFDFIPTQSPPDWEQRLVINLPSGLKDLVKELNAGAELSSLGSDGVLDAYIKMKNILEQKMCHCSFNEWTTWARNMDEESIGTGFVSQSVLTLDEEDASLELIEASFCIPSECEANY